jgi:hypothetical protein
MTDDAAINVIDESYTLMNLCEILSDAVWFWVLQAGFVLFALIAWLIARKRGVVECRSTVALNVIAALKADAVRLGLAGSEC